MSRRTGKEDHEGDIIDAIKSQIKLLKFSKGTSSASVENGAVRSRPLNASFSLPQESRHMELIDTERRSKLQNIADVVDEITEGLIERELNAIAESIFNMTDSVAKSIVKEELT